MNVNGKIGSPTDKKIGFELWFYRATTAILIAIMGWGGQAIYKIVTENQQMIKKIEIELSARGVRISRLESDMEAHEAEMREHEAWMREYMGATSRERSIKLN